MVERRHLVNLALVLGFITVIYNIMEGIFSVYFGASDEALTLLGFGLDSFVEVMSGIGIVHMIFRMKRNQQVKETDQFERTALRITGTAFYLLTVGLVIGTGYNLWMGQKPETTIPGMIIASISIVTMVILVAAKISVGKRLGSEALLADANCSKVCIYLSFVLLGASLLYWLFGVKYFDSLGSLAIAYFAWREGREAFEKALKKSLSCCSCHGKCGE